MADNIENKVGLQNCFWKINGKDTWPAKGGSYVLYSKDNNEFFVDKRSVGGKTTNPESTIAHAKWAFIYDEFFKSFMDAEDKYITENLWGPLSGGKTPILKFNLGNRYKVGNSIKFNPSGNTYYYGYKQRIELFSSSPGTGFYFYVVPVTKSFIGYAYFTKSEDVKHYGENVSLQIMFHGYNLDGKNKYKAKVYLLDENEAKGLTDTDDFEDKNLWENVVVQDLTHSDSSSNYNCYLKHNFNINVDWKKGSTEKKNFTVVVEVYRIYSEPGVIYGTNNKEDRVDYINFADKPTNDLVNYDSKLLKLEDIDNKTSISSRFMVSAELMDQYLTRIEIEKNNQIQYIGDIRYTRKEFDPCGFSKITITEDENTERVPFVIFDENDTTNPIDRTSNAFSIIAGDTRKNVSITLDNLITTETFCQGLLLPAGQKHTNRENVFQVNTVIPGLRNRNGSYPTTEDRSQPGDTDVQADNVRGASRDVSDVQQWVVGTDYNFESNEKIILKLKYNYNKNYESALAKLLGYPVDTVYSLVNTSVQSIAWVSRYIFLLSDYKQIYYLPISTCRYPNQIAKIDVYPDFEWWINLKYNTESPLFVKQSPNYKHRDFTTTDNQSQSVAKDLKKETDDNWKLKEKKYKLDLEAVFKINGKEHPLIPGDGFPILNAIKFFLKAYEIFKQLSFSDETAASEANIARGTARTSDGLPAEKSMTKRYVARRAIGKPFRITVTLPSLSGGIHGKFSQSKVSPNLIGNFYKLEFAAKPLFGVTGELDLLFYAQFIGPIGQAMYRLSQIVRKVNYLTLGAVKIDYYINIGAKVDFNVEFTGVEYHSIDGWDGGELQVYIPIELYLNAGADINASIEGIGTAGIDARIEGKAEFEVRATYDKRENKCPALLKFNGLSAKVWIKFSASDRTDGDPEDPDEKPDHTISIIDPTDAWQINIL